MTPATTIRRWFTGFSRRIPRDAYGHFTSDHRSKVHAKCREICAAKGMDVPKVLRS